MALAVVERNALLEEVWERQMGRDYFAIVQLLGGLSLEDHLKEPELGLILSLGWYQLGEYRKPLSLLVELTGVCERRGNTRLARRRRNNEALMRLALGDLDVAEDLLHESITHAEHAQDTFILAAVYNNLGMLYSHRGMTEFSLSHHRRSIAAGQRLGDARHVALCHMNMGVTYMDAKLLPEADHHLAHAAELSRGVGSESEIAHIEYNQAALRESQGDTKLASEIIDRAFQRFKKLENRKGEGLVYHLLGRIAMREGHPGEARRHLEHSVTLLRNVDFLEAIANALVDLAELAYLEHRFVQARNSFAEAMEQFEKLGNTTRMAEARARLESADAQARQAD